MPTVKSFNDTSAVSLAYAIGNGADATEFQGEEFNLIPYTTEGFQMSKEPKMSTAITNDRRPNNSKNTKGTASGSFGTEFGLTPLFLDLLSLSLMNTWQPVDEVDLTKGTYITDGDEKLYMCVEKTSKAGPGEADMQFHERYYGTAVNEATVEFSDGELVTMSVSTMSVFADLGEAAQGADGLGGSLAIAKIVPEEYEIADSSNNLKTLILRNDQGQAMEVVFSDLSLQVQNNVREQPGLGKEFAAGMGFGKVAVTLSGEIYFYDQTLLKAHMANRRLSGEMTIETREGELTLHFPNLMVQTPTNNSEGENQDYKTSLTLSGERGEVVLDGDAKTCVVAAVYKAATP